MKHKNLYLLFLVAAIGSLIGAWTQYSNRSTSNSTAPTNQDPTITSLTSSNSSVGLDEPFSVSSADQHELTITVMDDPDPMAGDVISAVLTKKGGGTPAYTLHITYLVVLMNGHSKTIGQVGVSSPFFRHDVTFGRKPGGDGDISVSDLQSVTATVTGGASLTIPLTLQVAGDSTVRKSLP